MVFLYWVCRIEGQYVVKGINILISMRDVFIILNLLKFVTNDSLTSLL